MIYVYQITSDDEQLSNDDISRLNTVESLLLASYVDRDDVRVYRIDSSAVTCYFASETATLLLCASIDPEDDTVEKMPLP